MSSDKPAAAGLSGTRVLLIEDDASTQKLYERRLDSLAVNLVCAGTADEGLRRLTEENFDLLILDLTLPKNIHGSEVLRQLEAKRIELPIVVITGHSDLDHARSVMPFQISSYHLKGSDTLERLPEILSSALQSFELKRARAEAQKERSRLEFFLERSGWLYLFIDSEARILEANAAALDAFGRSENEVIGLKFWELLHPSLREAALARWPEFVRGSVPAQPWLVTHKRPDGDLISVEWSYTTYEGANGDVRGVIAFGRMVTERREAEIRARVLFEEALTGIALIDKKSTQIVEINNVGASYFGADAQELKGKSLTTHFSDEDRSLFEKKIEQLRTSADSVSGEAHARRADGSQFTLGYRASRIVVGARPMVILLCRDLTELRDVENKYRELFHRSLQPIFVVDFVSGTIEDCNPAFERLVARAREELVGADVFTLLEPGEAERLKPVVATRMQVGEDVEFETTLVRPGGQRMWVAGRTSSVVFNNRALYITFIRDLTGEKEAEERYKKMFLQGNDPIVIFDDAMRGIVDANPAFLELSGYSLEKLRARSRNDFLVESPAGEPTHGGRFAATLRTADGEEIPVSYRRADLEIAGARNTMLTLHDLRPEKRAQELERSLVQIQKMQALGQMASGIAHDFNNTLMAALPWADLLRRKYPEDETIQKSADHIRKAVHRAKGVTRQLLDFAQPKLPERKRVNLAQHLAYEMKIIRSAIPPEVAIDLKIAEGEFDVHADPAQLSQVLLNLALNARDAMHGRGKLIFELRHPTPAEALRANVTRDRHAVVSVRDDGIGMDRETIAKIFDPFYTTKDIGHGAGLGLSVVLRLIEQHGGKIHVESEPARGSTFLIFLPLARVEVSEVAPPRGEIASARYNGLSVLLIDDEVSIAEGIKMLLKAEGATVSTATRGQRALKYIEEGLRPDFIILDLGLPEMPGEQVYSALRQTLPEVPVLIASGYGDRDRIGVLLRDENTRFQQKPYEIGSLFREIDYFRARKRA